MDLNKDSSFQNSYAVVDTEATDAFYKRGGRLIQIGIVLIDNFKITRKFNFLINPDSEIPQPIQNLTGITFNDIKNKPFFKDIAQEIISLLEGRIFIGHNVNFDLGFINNELERANFEPLKVESYDTLTLSQIIYPSLESYKLSDLIESLNLKKRTAHSAIYDAEMTADLLFDLYNKVKNFPNETVEIFREVDFKLVNETQDFFRGINGNKNSSSSYYNFKNILINDFFSDSKPEQKHHSTSRKNIFLNSLKSKNDTNIYEEKNNLIISNSEQNATLDILFLLSNIISRNYNDKIIISFENYKKINEMRDNLDSFFKNISYETKISFAGNYNDFINIEIFYKNLMLYKEKSKLELLAYARIIFWLLETSTGSFVEFKNNYNEDIFESVSQIIPIDNKIFNFYRINKNKINDSDIFLSKNKSIFEAPKLERIININRNNEIFLIFENLIKLKFQNKKLTSYYNFYQKINKKNIFYFFIEIIDEEKKLLEIKDNISIKNKNFYKNKNFKELIDKLFSLRNKK